MFENDDWTFDDDFDERISQSYSTPQSRERIPSAKRHKPDNDCNASSSSMIKESGLEWSSTINTKDNNTACSSNSSTSRGDLLLGIFQKNVYQDKCDIVKGTNSKSLYLKEAQYASQSFKDNTVNIQRDKRSNNKNFIKSISKEAEYASQSFKDNTVNIHRDKKSDNKKYVKCKSKEDVNKEVKLIRIFPGPAGLVPNIRKDDISSISYLNRVKEVEDKIVTKRKIVETNLPRSQDTKNLFEGGAWKLLLKDLPNNFLKEYGISAIKNRANASDCYSMKVKFMAGILDSIDHNHDDPCIMLKDSTDIIEGTIHRDILLNYPGVFEPNVVVLLHDVGLLKAQRYVITNKYHILISQVNLLAVYSNEERILTMPHMKDTLSNTWGTETNTIPVSQDYVASDSFNESQITNNDDNTSLRIHSFMISPASNNFASTSVNNPQLRQLDLKYNNSRKKTFNENSVNCVNTDKTSELVSINNNINRISFTRDNDEFIRDQNCHDDSLRESTLQTDKTQQRELQTQNISYLRNINKETVNFNEQVKRQNLSQVLQECVTEVENQTNESFRISLDVDKSNKPELCMDQLLRSSENSVLSYEEIKTHENSNLSINSTSSLVKNKENGLISYFTHNNDFDSDDEILSQLDMDKIIHKNDKSKF